MLMDQHNPVIKLCVVGMTAENDGLHVRARMLQLPPSKTFSQHPPRC